MDFAECIAKQLFVVGDRLAASRWWERPVNYDLLLEVRNLAEPRLPDDVAIAVEKVSAERRVSEDVVDAAAGEP